MSLLWVKLANHGDKSMVGSGFLKACIVLNGLNKSFLHRESIELQTN